MKLSMNKLSWTILIVISLSTMIYAQSNGWNTGDNNDDEELQKFCSSYGMEFSMMKEYNRTWYIICENFDVGGTLKNYRRFEQNDTIYNQAYECSITLEQRKCNGGVSFDRFTCYPYRENKTSSINCERSKSKGEWWEIRP